jgi:HSP90 family molecular chaperone
LSLPSLASVLRPAGHDVVQMDVNVEMYDLFFSRRFLEHVVGRIAHERQHLQEVQGQRQLDEEEQELLEKLLTCTPELFEQLSNDVERAKKILRSQAFLRYRSVRVGHQLPASNDGCDLSRLLPGADLFSTHRNRYRLQTVYVE